MTVGELKERLNEFDDNIKIFGMHTEEEFHYEIDEIGLEMSSKNGLVLAIY